MEHLSAEAFSKMKNVRLLKIGQKLPEDSINGTMQLPKNFNRGMVQLPKGLSYLSNELHFLEWYRYPLKSMPTGFQPNKLVELKMHCSRSIQLWKGIMVRFSLKQMCIFFFFIDA